VTVQSANTHFGKCFAYIIQLERLDHGFDFFHGVFLNALFGF